MPKIKTLGLSRALFLIGVIILLVPVWSGKYFLTSDGPSHLYNAQVLSDLLSGHNTSFYHQFYDLNTELEPNWFSHAVLIVLLKLFPAFIAEKFFLTSFVLGFAFGLRKLILLINPKAEWAAVLGLAFVYHKTFMMGFYNCSFSFVIFFFFLSYWLKNRDIHSAKMWLVLTAYFLLLFFTHPMGLMLAVASPISIMFVDRSTQNYSFKRSFKFVLSAAPAIILLFLFLLRAKQKPLPLTESTKVLYHKLIEADFLYILNQTEKWVAASVSMLLGMGIVLLLLYKIKSKRIHLADAFLPIAIVVLITYFLSPAALAGGGFFTERFQFIVFLLLLLWLAGTDLNKSIRNGMAFLAFGVGSTLVLMRVPHHFRASQAVEEYVSVADHIDEQSVVLPISFNHKGLKKNSQEHLVNHFWMFVHAGEYLGTKKAIVTLTNYEANTGYFPLSYKKGKNPFEIIGSVEKYMPTPNVSDYHQTTNQHIDFVVLWCLSDEQRETEEIQIWLEDLNKEYEKTFISEFGRAELYKRKE